MNHKCHRRITIRNKTNLGSIVLTNRIPVRSHYITSHVFKKKHLDFQDVMWRCFFFTTQITLRASAILTNLYSSVHSSTWDKDLHTFAFSSDPLKMCTVLNNIAFNRKYILICFTRVKCNESYVSLCVISYIHFTKCAFFVENIALSTHQRF